MDKNSDLFFEELGETLYLSNIVAFWNVFYTTSNIEELNNSLNIFTQTHSTQLMVTDIVGNEEQCLSINTVLKEIVFNIIINW